MPRRSLGPEVAPTRDNLRFPGSPLVLALSLCGAGVVGSGGCGDTTAPGSRDGKVGLYDLGGPSKDTHGGGDDGLPRVGDAGGKSDARLVTDDGGTSSDGLVGCGASCKGCCKASNCVAGTSVQACGSGGGTCKVCKSGQSCVAGQCVQSPKCDASNCPGGCCDSTGTCRQGTSAQTCGSGGARCQACASGAQCVSQKCTSSAKSYNVVLVSAKTPNGCGTFDSKCDVYVKVTVNSTKSATSKVINDNNYPVWNATLLSASASDLLASFYVEIKDEDIAFDDLLCKGTISLTQSDLTAGGVKARCNTSVSEIVFRFVAK